MYQTNFRREPPGTRQMVNRRTSEARIHGTQTVGARSKDVRCKLYELELQARRIVDAHYRQVRRMKCVR